MRVCVNPRIFRSFISLIVRLENSTEIENEDKTGRNDIALVQ